MATATVAVIAAILGLAMVRPRQTARAQQGPSLNPIDARRAYGYLKQICALGPRPSGSPAMVEQQKMVGDHFRRLGATVKLQHFTGRDPLSGRAVPMANLIANWHPRQKKRVLLCAHYDTRPFPDRDRANPRGVFIGANDGGSGVALLMELAHHMPGLASRYGVDFVLLDAEELVYDTGFRERGEYFVGARYFAEQYAAGRLGEVTYRWGVLLDMVGDADLQIYYEKHSVTWSETRPLVRQIWGVASRLGVREFVGRVKHNVRDDHLMLRNVGRIPTCAIIDFDFPHWHTQGDRPETCSGESLAKVGWVVLEWLRQVR